MKRCHAQMCATWSEFFHEELVVTDSTTLLEILHSIRKEKGIDTESESSGESTSTESTESGGNNSHSEEVEEEESYEHQPYDNSVSLQLGSDSQAHAVEKHDDDPDHEMHPFDGDDAEMSSGIHQSALEGPDWIISLSDMEAMDVDMDVQDMAVNVQHRVHESHEHEHISPWTPIETPPESPSEPRGGPFANAVPVTPEMYPLLESPEPQ